jgi:thiol-disulfide isomerase/thioredoxin
VAWLASVVSVGGLVGVLAAVVVVAVVAVVLRSRDGKVRAGRAAAGGWALAGHDPAPADRVLLLQLSSTVCMPCRQTADVLERWQAGTPGVVHVEIDVADRPEVASELGVMRTPTVVAFDRAGAEVVRVSGVPKVAELEVALATQLTGQ